MCKQRSYISEWGVIACSRQLLKHSTQPAIACRCHYTIASIIHAVLNGIISKNLRFCSLIYASYVTNGTWVTWQVMSIHQYCVCTLAAINNKFPSLKHQCWSYLETANPNFNVNRSSLSTRPTRSLIALMLLNY